MKKAVFIISIFCLGCGTTSTENTTTTQLKKERHKYSNASGNTNTDNSTPQISKSAEIVYEGTMTDNQSGISQNYTLYLKSDFSAASIGGGPYSLIEDQRNGTYMWLDGTIIGMSFKPMKDKCIVYGSDGGYFCTLFRK